MLDVGWTELLVIGALALIVVGPRDLPQLLRTVGQAVGKIKRMAREFQRSMEDAAREADVGNFKELRDLKKDMGSFDFRKQAGKAQSYLNQPVKPEAGTTASGAVAASSESAAERPAPSEAPSAPLTPDDGPSAAPGTGPAAADTAEPRKAGTGG
jgi:sec-independent protein translocase protein TatB